MRWRTSVRCSEPLWKNLLTAREGEREGEREEGGREGEREGGREGGREEVREGEREGGMFLLVIIPQSFHSNTC